MFDQLLLPAMFDVTLAISLYFYWTFVRPAGRKMGILIFLSVVSMVMMASGVAPEFGTSCDESCMWWSVHTSLAAGGMIVVYIMGGLVLEILRSIARLIYNLINRKSEGVASDEVMWGARSANDAPIPIDPIKKLHEIWIF